jgi:hypothetical protein
MRSAYGRSKFVMPLMKRVVLLVFKVLCALMLGILAWVAATGVGVSLLHYRYPIIDGMFTFVLVVLVTPGFFAGFVIGIICGRVLWPTVVFGLGIFLFFSLGRPPQWPALSLLVVARFVVWISLTVVSLILGHVLGDRLQALGLRQ